MRIVVAGGTGFLGTHLVTGLRDHAHQVTVLTRTPRRPDEVRWSPGGSDGTWARALDGADAVINLAGAPIAAGRWTAARKAAIRESRVRATRALAAALASAQRPPAVFISSSAIGIYGPHGEEAVTEDAPLGNDFLASVGKEWEAEALAVARTTRVVLLRTGLALDRHGGALPRIARPFSVFAGGPLGSGRQYMSWIHLDDWTAMARWALTDDRVSGALNATAPNPVTNREFARTLGRVLGRPSIMPAPAFALRLALGEMADAVLTGQRVLPAKAESLGFEFRHPRLEPALRAIFGRG